MQHARARPSALPLAAEQHAPHRYLVHIKGKEGRHAIDGAESFTAAALLFAETAASEAEDDLTIVVTEAESGHTECFVIALHTNKAKPC